MPVDKAYVLVKIKPMPTETPTITVQKVNRSFFVFAGKARLMKCVGAKNEADAMAFVFNNAKLIAYWASSAGVQINNTEPVIINA